jgi:predicted MFS family arabinose efflux permease
MLSAFAENGLVTNLAAMLTEHGVTVQAAALALSVSGGAGIVGRLFTGFLIDRLPAQRVQTGILLLFTAGTLILAFSGNLRILLRKVLRRFKFQESGIR